MYYSVGMYLSSTSEALPDCSGTTTSSRAGLIEDAQREDFARRDGYRMERVVRQQKERKNLPKIARNSMQILDEIFRPQHIPRSPELVDVVFVAIDFENTEMIKHDFKDRRHQSQVGLAILDTREMYQKSPDKMISAYNFATGSRSYIRRHCGIKRSKFGETVQIRCSDMAKHIQSCIPPDRNIVLVGHQTQNELICLQALGFIWPRFLSAVLDTIPAADEIFGRRRKTSLLTLLGRLEIPCPGIHCAGNDANYTLRALLLLYVRYCRAQELSQEGNCDMLAVLSDIALPTSYAQILAQGREAQEMEGKDKRERKNLGRESLPPTWPIFGTDDSLYTRTMGSDEAEMDLEGVLQWMIPYENDDTSSPHQAS